MESRLVSQNKKTAQQKKQNTNALATLEEVAGQSRSKFVAATAMVWLLDKIGIRHEPSYDEGYEHGFEKGRMILEIKDTRDKKPKTTMVDDFLFDAWKLKIPPDVKTRMIRDVEQKLPEKKQPNLNQWQMIFSDSPATNVVAGAGSGKSTTLVLRILLLHHYLGFELDCMTVVTFTKMSQIDFAEKVVEIFSLWNVPHDKDQIGKKVVRTFHSKILDFIREYSGMEGVKAFEFCREKVPTDEEEESIDINPFDAVKTGGYQRQLLSAAYTTVYRRSHDFRVYIEQLYRNSLVQERLSKDDPQVKDSIIHIKKISDRDHDVAKTIENAWRKAGKWPIPGITAQMETITVAKKPFVIHGRVGTTGQAVVLSPQKYPGLDFTRHGAASNIRYEFADKWAVFQVYCQEEVIKLNAENDGTQYIAWLAQKATTAPGFNHQLPGDIKTQELLDSFLSIGSFIENLGLDVSQTVGKLNYQKESIDRAYFDALSEFWIEFDAHLDRQIPRVMTFNKMFALFGERNPNNLKGISSGLLRSMSHLMIDEFQDISPQIVSWLRATFREIRLRGNDLHEDHTAKHSSLLCVGDDWQSIYGWRGSSPLFFINFKDEFKASRYCSVMMRENYRSHQHVIDAAELMVANVTSVEGKKAIASGPSAGNIRPVVILDRDDAALQASAIEMYSAGKSVMVICRSRSNRDALGDALSKLRQVDNKLSEKKRRLSILTYHGSKGLEADAVYLVGDCIHLANSPSKNQIYLIAGMGKDGDQVPYDTAQKEEILRLAYVAITRAAEHCHWYIDPDKKSGSNKPRASSRIGKNKKFFDDRRKVSVAMTAK